MTGDQSGIAKDIPAGMRDSGLAHLLSISGLHMAIVAGVVFLGLRSLLALIPRLAALSPDQEMGGGGGDRRTSPISCCRGDSRAGRSAAS